MDTILLFPEETTNAKPEQKKKRGKYHDKHGKFTDRTTAEIAALKKDNAIFKNNYYYYKRVNKRLCEEIKEVTAKLKELEEKLRYYEKENTQQQKVSVA